MVIVGAGLTGLLAAQGLKKRGFDVAVYEQEPHEGARPRDWTIVLHWALPAMEALLPADVRAALPQAICNRHLVFDTEAESFLCYSGLTGERLFASNMPGSRRVSRQRLRHVLATSIDVQWGKAVESIDDRDGRDDQKICLSFADGTTAEADFVLGTDGASSRVRSLLVGPEKAQSTRSGLMFGTAIVQYKDADKVAAVVRIWKDSMASLQGEAALEYMRTHTSKLCPMFQDQVDWTPPGSACNVDEMRYWVPVPFNNHDGRVTLAGDAAHPMLIYRGQGYQHAITDVDNYIKALVKIRDAGWAAGVRTSEFATYDDDLVTRGAAAVEQSVQEAELSFDKDSISKMRMVRKGHGRSA
ncbi:FAD-binding domain containing protein [Grosmannia clavigera kw1407]|uniref:FAD-binding domain containing protein n=1 Tax=Grosmannia clavigera (strain kw1407 / UAMH 11150) TaxID=655863 RepID=F0XGJ9_GROCL|nr:FAD-binding domain containing protein [Grosmannia clavigera kw1407]EFX02647.1 FAD-binding domain containing protein [Grosmannia clavigera kw1407]